VEPLKHRIYAYPTFHRESRALSRRGARRSSRRWV